MLDFGDPDTVADVSRRIAKGFTLWRWGALETASPRSPDLIGMLSAYYLQEGLLVFLEEPTWSGREHSLEDRLSNSWTDADTADSTDELFEREDATEIVSLDDLPQLETAELVSVDESGVHRLVPMIGADTLDDSDDDPTEVVLRPK